jgi:hypothetical protein
MVLAVAAIAQQPRPAVATATRQMQAQKRVDILDRAYELRPRRRDSPMRYINLSDNEMREIQDVASRHLSRTVLNVSPVIEGCACEEGPLCTDQVYVVMHASGKSVGLQLSRVKKIWKVGVVQLWWLKYDALRAQGGSMDYQKFLRAEGDLLREFPVCVSELATEGKQ